MNLAQIMHVDSNYPMLTHLKDVVSPIIPLFLVGLVPNACQLNINLHPYQFQIRSEDWNTQQ